MKRVGLGFNFKNQNTHCKKVLFVRILLKCRTSSEYISMSTFTDMLIRTISRCTHIHVPICLHTDVSLPIDARAASHAWQASAHTCAELHPHKINETACILFSFIVSLRTTRTCYKLLEIQTKAPPSFSGLLVSILTSSSKWNDTTPRTNLELIASYQLLLDRIVLQNLPPLQSLRERSKS